MVCDLARDAGALPWRGPEGVLSGECPAARVGFIGDDDAEPNLRLAIRPESILVGWAFPADCELLEDDPDVFLRSWFWPVLN